MSPWNRRKWRSARRADAEGTNLGEAPRGPGVPGDSQGPGNGHRLQDCGRDSRDSCPRLGPVETEVESV